MPRKFTMRVQNPGEYARAFRSSAVSLGRLTGMSGVICNL